jgi:hypothetical protein
VRLGNDNNSETTVVSGFVSDVGASSLPSDSLTSGWCPPASDSFVHVLRKDYSRLWNGRSSMAMLLQGLGSGLHEVSFCMAHPVVPKPPLQKLLLILLKLPFSPSG